MKVTATGYLLLHDDFSKKEYCFWKDFCEKFVPPDIVQFSNYIDKYKKKISEIVYDYEELRSFSHKSEILSHPSFKQFCFHMDTIVPDATKEQHYLFLLLASDLTRWDLVLNNQSAKNLPKELFDQDGHLLTHFVISKKSTEELFGATLGNKKDMLIQTSFITTLIEHNMMRRIYPQLDFLTSHTISGFLLLSYIDSNKTSIPLFKVIKEKKIAPALYKRMHSKNDWVEQLRYSHTEKQVAWKDNNFYDKVNTHFGFHQTYLINFIDYIEMEREYAEYLMASR